VAAVGATAVYGHSSGAGLVAHAVAGGLAVDRLVLHEPPWNGDDPEDAAASRELAALIGADLAEGRPGDAVRRFLAPMGMPDEVLDATASDPAMLAVAPTMPYDLAVMGDVDGGALPEALVVGIDAPTLVVVGTESGDFFRATADRLVDLLPRAELAVLAGADHGATADLVAPPVARFLTA
jgi:pimeloyl-ACP methyl ester carboxylesterase